MKKTAALSVKSRMASAAPQPLPVPDQSTVKRRRLVQLFAAWQQDCCDLSPKTRATRESTFHLLLWFLEFRGYDQCGTSELRDWFSYMSADAFDDDEEYGRWGEEKADRPAAARSLKRGTIRTYYGQMQAFFNWALDQGEIKPSPLAPLKRLGRKNDGRQDQILPFTDDDLKAMLMAAKYGPHSKRDEAIILLLVDTGMRISEMCALNIADADTTLKKCRVLGKGDKERSLFFGKTTAKAIWNYKQEPRKIAAPSMAPLFSSDRGPTAGERLTDSGVRQMLTRLGIESGIIKTDIKLKLCEDWRIGAKNIRSEVQKNIVEMLVFAGGRSEASTISERLNLPRNTSLYEELHRKKVLKMSRVILNGPRVSPHTFRHTFAVKFLRNGGNAFSLMELLGHEDMTMTQRYVRFVQADIEQQHRRFSPADSLGLGGSSRRSKMREKLE